MDWQSQEEKTVLELEAFTIEASKEISLEKLLPVLLRCAADTSERGFCKIAYHAITTNNAEVFRFAVRCIVTELGENTSSQELKHISVLWFQVAHFCNFKQTVVWLEILKAEKLPAFHAMQYHYPVKLYGVSDDTSKTFFPVFDWITAFLYSITTDDRPNKFWTFDQLEYLITPTPPEYFAFIQHNLALLARYPILLDRALKTFGTFGAVAALSEVVKSQNLDSFNIILKYLPYSIWEQEEIDIVNNSLSVENAHYSFLFTLLQTNFPLNAANAEALKAKIAYKLSEDAIIQLFTLNNGQYFDPNYFKISRLLNMVKLRKLYKVHITPECWTLALKRHCSEGDILTDLASINDVMPKNQPVSNLTNFFKTQPLKLEVTGEEMSILRSWHTVSTRTAAPWEVWKQNTNTINDAIATLRHLKIPIPTIRAIQAYYPNLPKENIKIIEEHLQLKPRITEAPKSPQITTAITLG